MEKLILENQLTIMRSLKRLLYGEAKMVYNCPFCGAPNCCHGCGCPSLVDNLCEES